MESNTEALLVALNDSNSDTCVSDCSIEDRIDEDFEEEIESEFGSGTPSTVSCYASEISTSTSSCNSTVPSLLAVLHAPKLSEISRKRKTYSNTNSTRGGKRRKNRGSSSSASEPKNIKPQQRLKKYPNEQLDISAGKLFCKACREELSLKCSSIVNHIKSAKHQDGKKD